MSEIMEYNVPDSNKVSNGFIVNKNIRSSNKINKNFETKEYSNTLKTSMPVNILNNNFNNVNFLRQSSVADLNCSTFMKDK